MPFIVLKRIVSISRFHCKNLFEKRYHLGQDISEKTLIACSLAWGTMFKTFFANSILARGGGGLFFKLIFVLKLWDQDNCFESNKRCKQSEHFFENLVQKPQKFPQKLKKCCKSRPD